MSLSIESSPLSSLIQSSFNAQLLASTTAASGPSDSTSIDALTTSALGGSGSGLSGLGNDLASLFKDLASKDVSAAQTDLAKLQQDFGTTGTSSSAGSSSSTPLQELFSSLSSSLSSGDTAGALKTLAGFFAQGGSPTGNVVNTTA
jgi:hypothetical protein